ncbi:MAG: hypothetical protein M1819_002697 [Sarea resinae]|nr:MAG: hypothetical protein M1819_002697 [Sarea resinae]
MPLVELLPASSTTAAPGWAYVASGLLPDSSQAAANDAAAGTTGAATANSGKRPVRRTQASGGGLKGPRGRETSARQDAAILKRIAELERENARDVAIPVPVRARDGLGRVSKGKGVTTAVRKILSSQKTFANHLADEEALLAQHASTNTAAANTNTNTNTAAVAATTDTTSKPTAKQSKTAAARNKRASTTGSTPAPTPAPVPPPQKPATPITPASLDATNPLLRSHLPTPPSPATLNTLLPAPPLSYGAARVAPPALSLPVDAEGGGGRMGVPTRKFCEICGYWGRVRCMRCGVRVCGKDCLETHGEGKCLRFYA